MSNGVKFLERCLLLGDDRIASTEPSADIEAGGDFRLELCPADDNGDSGDVIVLYEYVL